ncbi:MAG: VWA domain-containing protein [Acidimicrobiales bacterium]
MTARHTPRLVEGLFATLLGLLLLALLVAPARAQEEVPEPVGDPVVEDELGPPVGDEPADESVESETSGPVIREIVDDGDRAVQILSVDDTDRPLVDVILAVPPVLAGDLSARSFAMTENGSLREISVAKLRDTLEVVVVIDTSGSMSGEPIDNAKTAAKSFVDQLDDETRVAVVGFGATASVSADLDSSRAEVDAAIDGLQAGGETALYDGLVLASSQFQDPEARRFVVVLSDGTDTVSSSTLDDTSQAFMTQEISLYAITLQSEDADFSGLQTLARGVNGQVVSAADAESLRATYASVASRLTNQYLLRYRSGVEGEAQIVISVDSAGVLAIAKDTVDIGAPVGDQATEDGTGTVGGSSARVNIDTSSPLISVVPTDDSLLNSENAVYIGAAGIFVSLLVALAVALTAEPEGPSAFERLNFKPSKGTTPRSGLAAIADRASGVADRILEKQQRRGALDAALEQAGMDMRPGEYIMTAAGAALAMGAFGFVMQGPLGGLVMFGAGVLGGKMFVNFKAKQRQRAFANQLGDTLLMIAGSIRAGHGVVEAIDTVAAQAEAPTGEEFTRAVAEARIGRDMVDSLYDIAERTNSEDFIWVVRAISINRELGGDLAEILDNVGETIRDRNRLRDQVKALSAEGKVSAFILFGLPILVAIWVQISNPEYMDAMTGETAGKVVFGFAVFALVAGGVWLKKLVKVDF